MSDLASQKHSQLLQMKLSAAARKAIRLELISRTRWAVDAAATALSAA